MVEVPTNIVGKIYEFISACLTLYGRPIVAAVRCGRIRYGTYVYIRVGNAEDADWK